MQNSTVSPLFTALCRNAGFSVNLCCCYCCCCFKGGHHLASCPLDTWEMKLSEPFMTSQRANWGKHKEERKNISQGCSEFSDWTETEIWTLVLFSHISGTWMRLHSLSDLELLPHYCSSRTACRRESYEKVLYAVSILPNFDKQTQLNKIKSLHPCGLFE